MEQMNDGAFFVAEYNVRKVLAGLGYRFDPEKLTNLEVDCFMLIESEFAKRRLEKSKGRGR